MTHELRGEWVRQAREMAGLTQGNLANLAMTCRSTVARVEAGSRCIPSIRSNIEHVFMMNGVIFTPEGPRKVAALPWSERDAVH